MRKCNMCNKGFDMWDEQENFCFEHKVGYGSAHDGEYIKLNLCCDCFDKVIGMIAPFCKTSPFTDNQCDFKIASINASPAFDRETKINNGG